MPIRFRVDPDLRCVFLTGVPPISDEDLARYQHELSNHPDHGPGFDQLADMRGITGLGLTASGMRAAGQLTTNWAEHITGTKLAIIAPAEAAYGMARMFSAFAFEGLEVRVFRELEDGEQWIAQGKDTSGASVA